MANYYEDTMPLVTNEDEYLKYFMEETLPLFDKLTIIIKKGQPFQRQALLNNLNLYIRSSLFKTLIQYIISEIETWDLETILLFPKCLHNILIKSLSLLDNELFNIIFKHIIVSISSGNEKLSNEYIYYFEIIITYFTNEFNNKGKKFPFIIGNDIYEIIFSLGKFGQNPENMKLCCYLASCMCRIMGPSEDNENIQKMLKRILLLFCDLEKTTERQISRELNYLIPIFRDKILEKPDIIQAIKSYINHDSDHIIQATTILSLLDNINYISTELKELIMEKIKEIFEDNNYEDEYKDNIVNTIINSLYKLCLEYENKNKTSENEKNEDVKERDKSELYEVINRILQLNFMKNFFNKETIDPLLIINFEKISLILKNCTLYQYNNNYSYGNHTSCNNSEECRITIDDIFIRIYSKLYPKNITCNTNNNNSNPNETSMLTEERNERNENIKTLFIINLYKIIPCLNCLKNNKCLYEKINNIFKKDTIISVLKKYEVEYSNNTNTAKSNYLYKFLLSLLDESQHFININNSNNNLNKITCSTNISNNTNSNNLATNSKVVEYENYYTKLFHNILGNIFSSFNQSRESFSNQIHLLVAKTLQKIIKQIYKYHKAFSQNTKDKITTDKIYDEIFNNFLVNIIINENLGNFVKIEYINIFPYLILYGKDRQKYLNFLEDEILKSPYFFTRRYSINFIEKCLNKYSFNLFIKFSLLEVVYNLINDENNIISACIIDKILFFHKKIIISSVETFQNICKTLSKINKLNKDNKSVSIQNFDIEKNRTIKKILSIGVKLSENNKKSDEENKDEEYKKIEEKEGKLVMKESEIFGKSYQTISLCFGFNYNKKATGVNTNNEIKNKENTNSNNCDENNVSLLNCTFKDKNKKRKSWIEKSYSGVIHNISSKNNVKKYLPKIKNNSRKYSCCNRQFDITFSGNMGNNSNNMTNNIKIINKISNKTININKLVINLKEKCQESNFKSMNSHNRLPSAQTLKNRETNPICSLSSNLNGKNILFNKHGNHIIMDDNNMQFISINRMNQNNFPNDFFRHSGRMEFKELLNGGEISGNITSGGNKPAQSSKNVRSNFKNGFKNVKLKKDSCFNISNKITINAKINEDNKANK